ncbi:PorZ beta-propeller-like domain-containing protein [Dyadobacter sandarakinus]|uniref:PorZ N-terminal beta-propeller domain-containing protein n=1 Tax=Dyadobacter sandarakinus TaxID=2747268 RepID=A0ABX7ICE9_9BACT|nr:two-component regulator propeller domain-containing protein [Dyadobacter sandarakinus]QRR03490.1 hypothetical protein HWI92_22535 [Dyadobacter sandarakinus]
MKAGGVVWGLLLLMICRNADAQNIPLHTWQTHFSYLSARQIVAVNDQIFCATQNGFFRFNPDDKAFQTYSKINGLNDTGIGALAYNPADSILLLAYRNGNMDLLYLNAESDITEIENWPVLAVAGGLPENKQINKVTFAENKAYLCTNFGIVVLNAANRQVLETYRYIGKAGSEVSVTDVAFTADSMYAVTNEGTLRASLSASVNRQYFASWTNISREIVAVTTRNNLLYAAFAGKGIYKNTNTGWKTVLASTSSISHLSTHADEILVTADSQVISIDLQDRSTASTSPLFTSLQQVIKEGNRLWIADLKKGLLGNFTGSFQSFIPETGDTTLLPKNDSIITDLAGLTWTRLPADLGGGILVRDAAQNKQRLLSTSIGNGSLPSNAINSLALDEDGYIWFASDRGVGYFITDNVINSSRLDAVLPVFGNRKLFSTERCTAICVEPGNRKWIGTRAGLYLFNADGSEMVQKFTESDSPLPSAQIDGLEFEPASGLLYVDTPNGMVSYRSGASAPAAGLSAVTIFPNPVRPGYGGYVGIKGLVGNATVKITELSGRLIFETKSRGGTASWNLNDYTGKRARGGIYMVLVVNEDGSEKFAGKLAVID